MDQKSLTLEIKSVAEDGTFEGWLSVYGNIDLTGDVVARGAFSKTLSERGNKVPMLWAHRADQPIGDLILEDRGTGLWCKGRLLMSVPQARQAYALIKEGIVRGLSIGFQTVEDSVISGVRHLLEIRLFEGSIVTFPANEAALIQSVKQRDERQMERIGAMLEQMRFQLRLMTALIEMSNRVRL